MSNDMGKEIKDLLAKQVVKAELAGMTHVGWERYNTSHGWTVVGDEDVEVYARNGQEIRPVFVVASNGSSTEEGWTENVSVRLVKTFRNPRGLPYDYTTVVISKDSDNPLWVAETLDDLDEPHVCAEFASRGEALAHVDGFHRLGLIAVRERHAKFGNKAKVHVGDNGKLVMTVTDSRDLVVASIIDPGPRVESSGDDAPAPSALGR